MSDINIFFLRFKKIIFLDILHFRLNTEYFISSSLSICYKARNSIMKSNKLKKNPF